eukprot:GFKZ01004662.1.p1 GENE.GFKZ01004662.1~~GFKZ01004662.1.p1  ORF type:complete len:502 (+),score=77.07 GFKZ01004662.1:81-1586(+)
MRVKSPAAAFTSISVAPALHSPPILPPSRTPLIRAAVPTILAPCRFVRPFLRPRLPNPLFNSRFVMSASPSSSSYKYVVVGAGNAAGYAADEFAEIGVSPGEVCFVGEEPVAPYERPALSKAVLMKAAVRLPGFHTCVGGGGERHVPEWYAEKGMALKLGAKVVEVDVAAKTAVLEDGSKVSATDSMLLATGASPFRLTRTPGHDLKGVAYLRDNDDGVALYDALQANIGKMVIVVGGGYIGMEVAAAALTVGCKVTMIFPESHIMPRLFTPEIAAHYEKVYTDKGAILLNHGRLCKQFLGDDEGNVRGAMCCKEGAEDLEVEGTLVVVGVGAAANTALFKDKLEMDQRGGVVVDATMKTSVDGIYAVGDIATFPLKMYGGRPARMEHVQNARDSARHAVNAMVNKSTAEYDYLPYFYSRVFDLSWQFFGDNIGDSYVCGDFNPKLLAIWVTDGVLKGVFMEHPSAEETANMKKVAREQPTVDVDAFAKCETTDQGWALLL